MIIKSILDTDLYKFTTSYSYLIKFPLASGTFVFKDRNNTVFDKSFLEELKIALNDLSNLKLTDEEFNYLCNQPSLKRFMPEMYWEWLRGFRFDVSKIKVFLDWEGCLQLSVTDKLYRVTLYETPILAIISELMNKNNKIDIDVVADRLKPKIALSNIEKLTFSEFGARRRASYYVHDFICKELSEKANYCVGTSDVHFAMKYNMKPCGTFPHEWVMFHGACFGYQQANMLALQDWSDVYDGDLGIALIDTYTTKAFLSTFNLKFAKLFDGVRQDSGDEYKIGNMIIDHYKSLNIDPTTKTIVFSNALDFPKYCDIARYFNGRIRVSAGIGTNLTNDTGFDPVNIVMKLMRVRLNDNEDWRNCIKISDDLGKHMGDLKEIERCKYLFNI